jgi:sulfotransferase family protein
MKMEIAWDHLKVVAIFFWGRSGSVFLHSLFDSHPEVLTFPATRLNSFHARQWPDLASQPDLEHMVRRFVWWNPSLFDGRQDCWFEGLDGMGPGRDRALQVDAQVFARRLLGLLSGSEHISRKRFFLAAHFAYALARGQDVSRATTVVYHLHSPEAYAGIQSALSDFPELTAVGITREPVRSVLSYLRKNVLAARVWGQTDRADYEKLASTGAYNFVYRHQLIGWRELRARYRLPFWTLRLEDLNRDTEHEMRALARFLKLSWDPCLTRSTFNGLEYWGDQLSVGQCNGASVQAPSSSEADAALDGLDRYVLQGLLAKFRSELGYAETGWLQRTLSPLLLLLPTRLERLAFRSELRRARSGGDRSLAARRCFRLARQMLQRQSFSYRHLLCEGLPAVRAWLPFPAPLSPGLTLRRSPPVPEAAPEQPGSVAAAAVP